MLEDERRRRLFDHLLMAALDGAFPLAEVDEVTMFVAENLDLDVTWTLNEFFEINFARAKGSLGFAGSAAHGAFEVALLSNRAHAFATTAGGGFQQNRIADGRGNALRFGETCNSLLRAGHDGRTGVNRHTACGRL